MFKIAIIFGLISFALAVIFHILSLLSKTGIVSNMRDMAGFSTDLKIAGFIFYFIAWFTGGSDIIMSDTVSYFLTAKHCMVWSVIWTIVFFVGCFFVLLIPKARRIAVSGFRRTNFSALFLALILALSGFFFG